MDVGRVGYYHLGIQFRSPRDGINGREMKEERECEGEIDSPSASRSFKPRGEDVFGRFELEF